MNFPDSFKNHIMPDRIHILNVCFVVNKLEKSWGGTAGNIAYTIKMLGADPLVISTIGKDANEYLEHFKKLGISTEYISKSVDKLTASAYITTDIDDNQVTAFYNGPLGEVPSVLSVIPTTKEESLSQSPTNPTGILRSTQDDKIAVAIISPTDKTAMLKHLHECSERGIPTMFDPGQQITAFTDVELKSAISKSTFLIGNDYEIKLIQDKTGWSAQDILKETKTLVTTLGEKGSIISTQDGEVIEIAPCPPQSVDDPTGAGDAFRAGFLVGYEKGFELKTCGRIGSVAASYAIETYGTQEHVFTKEEFLQRYEKTYNKNLIL
jgi:adenosine kinase